MTMSFETTSQDISYAIRGFRKNRGVTAVTVLSLALAIGATTAVFSLVNAVLLRALPYRDAGRIVMLWTTNALNGALEQNTSLPNLRDWKARSRTFEDMAAYREFDGPLMKPGEPRFETDWIGYAAVTGNFFPLLGRAAALGRVFGTDDVLQRRPVAVISHRLWRRSFGAAAEVTGKVLNIGGLDLEVIGVMAEDFWFPTKAVDLWMPASLNPAWHSGLENRARRFGPVFGRLKPDVGLERARTEMRGIAAQLQQEYPAENADLGVNVIPLHVQVIGTSVPFMLAMLLGAVTFVLLIACANVANLQLARGMARRHEISLRAALGAGRRRIARQLMTESVLVACIGGGLGLTLAGPIVRALSAFAPRNIARLDDIPIDMTVLLFTFVLSVMTGLLFGLVPALRISRDGSNELLHASSRNVTGSHSARTLRGALVVCEFALAVVLLAGTGLLIRSLLAVRSVESGFRDRDVVTAQLRFHNALPRARRVALYTEAMERLGHLPGVRSVGAISTMFWDANVPKFGLRAVEGKSAESRDQWSTLTWTTIAGGYFQALSVPLRRGRFFTDGDRRDAPPVVLVNETMARRFWPGEDPIGKRIKGFDARGRNDEWVTVVGVVGDVRSHGLERAPIAQIFEAQAQSLDETENLVVSATAAEGIAVAIRKAVGELDRSAVVSDIATLDRVLGEQSSQRRFETSLLSAFAALALALAGAGIFGMMHYAVLQRTQELGIRMALGARRRQVLALVLRDGVGLAALGVGLGVAASAALTRTMASLLFGVTPADPMTFAAVCIALMALAVAGCWLPAARASRVDPMLALRGD
jgi:putative ABC transport system permease protein